MKTYTCLAEYFADHPDEEADYYDDMAEMEADEVIDYPEDYEFEVQNADS